MKVSATIILLFISPLSFANKPGLNDRVPFPGASHQASPSIHYKNKQVYHHDCSTALIASNEAHQDQFLDWSQLKTVLFERHDQIETALVFLLDSATYFDRPTNASELYDFLFAPGLLRVPEFNTAYRGNILSVVYGPTSEWMKYLATHPEGSAATKFRVVDLHASDDPLVPHLEVAIHGERRNYALREQNLAIVLEVLTRFNDGDRIAGNDTLKKALLSVVDHCVPSNRRDKVKALLESQTKIGPEDGLRLAFDAAVQTEFHRATVLIAHELLVDSDLFNLFAFERHVFLRAAAKKWGVEK